MSVWSNSAKKRKKVYFQQNRKWKESEIMSFVKVATMSTESPELVSRLSLLTIPGIYYLLLVLPSSSLSQNCVLFFSSDFCSNCIPFKVDSVKVIIPHGFYISLEPRVRYLQNMWWRSVGIEYDSSCFQRC